MEAEGTVYTHGHHESVLRSHRWRTAENSAAYLLPYLEPGMSVLDVGSGPGTVTVDLAARVAPGRVTAIEPTTNALELTRETAQRAGASTVEFAVADVLGLTFSDDTFDVVHAHQVLQHVPDPVLALREMRRVCKPGGIVAARDSDYAAFAWYPEIPELTEWLSLYRGLAKRNGGEPDAGRRLLSWARQADLDNVRTTASVWCFADADERAWWGTMWADRILTSSLAEQAISSGVASTEDLRRLADGWRGWAEADDGYFIVPHGEILARA